ncbi:MAG: diguanylate cyclase, partial [Polyangiales bacterium]
MRQWMTSAGRRLMGPLSVRVCSQLLLAGLFAWIALVLRESGTKSGEVLAERFRARVQTAAPFLGAYVLDVQRRERLVAERQLTGEQVTDTDLERVVRAFGFEAAVLVDDRGYLLSVFPARPEILGTYIFDRYRHLSRALAEGSAVSSVVGSAATNSRVAAFATRFSANTRMRVFSGAYDVTQIPLQAYMNSLMPTYGTSADLVDDRGAIVASSRDVGAPENSVATLDPQLKAALEEETTGVCRGRSGERLFASQAVANTPWRLVAAIDLSVLYAPLSDESGWLQWTLYGAFCAAVFVVVELLLRLAQKSVRLRTMNEELSRLARVDRLTGLSNRHHLEEQLARLNGAARRRRLELSIMVIDVDHFKAVNDTYGHGAGDEVLHTLARRMAGALRVEDMLGRWGGEEFLALLPNTDVVGALAVAERIRTAANIAPIVTSDGISLRVTVSIGCATSEGPFDESLISRADKAVYSAKTLGRDRVVSSDPPPLGHLEERASVL